MKKTVKLKPGEAAVVFKPGQTVTMVQNDEGLTEITPAISNAACVAFALQQPVFIEIVVLFLADLDALKNRMETETVH